MDTRTVLVLGARGRFGAAAVQAFASAGWRVLAQVRRPAPGGPAQELALPLHDTTALAKAATGATVVVHAVNPAYTRWPQEMLPLARQGMAVAQQLGATFMLPGNVYNYGPPMPARLTPATPQHPATRKGRLRQQLEDEMRARAAQGLRSVVIRAGDFFGSGTGSWLDLAIVKPLARGRLDYPGPLDQPHAWAYLPDLARAFVAVAHRGVPAGFTNLHFEGHTLTGAQLLAAIERAAGRGPLKRGSLPWGLMRAGGLLVPMWRELAEMAYLWQQPHALDGSALQALAGPLPHTPLDEAVAAALAALAPA